MKRCAPASMNNENKLPSAAEEPEPEPDDAASATGATSYDPTIYQRPHPDDRGGGKKGAAATKARGKTMDKGKAKDKAKGKAKAKDDGGHRCANCDKPGATSKCGRCEVEWYCDRECQKVRASWAVGLGGCSAAPTRPSTPCARTTTLHVQHRT